MKVYEESRWTRPRTDCPHPEWWHSTDPQSTELEVSELLAGLVRALQPEYVIETGTCVAQTAEAIGVALLENRHGELETFEIDCGLAMMNWERVTGLPVTLNMSSALEFTPTRRIDFAFFDSEIELRVPEFERFRPYLSPGAICAFHDTGPHKADGWGEKIRALPDVQTLQLPTPRGITLLQAR